MSIIKIYFLLTLKTSKNMQKKQRIGQLIVNLLVAIGSALATFFGVTN